MLPPVDMTLDVMGVKWILISDHAGDSGGFPTEYDGGTMSENLKGWFENQILFSDKPVFVFSHQPLSQWKVWDKLEGFIKGSKLQAWFYDHVHNWSAGWLKTKSSFYPIVPSTGKTFTTACSYIWSEGMAPLT